MRKYIVLTLKSQIKLVNSLKRREYLVYIGCKKNIDIDNPIRSGYM